MVDKKSDVEALQIIYEEILDQFKGNFRTYQTLRERLGQIIAFIGVILSLELLGVLQIFSTKMVTNYIEILVMSTIFIIISLITATVAYRITSFNVIETKTCLNDEFIYKSKVELLKIINKRRIKHINENKDILHKKATFAHVSLNTLFLAIFFLAVFIILNIYNNSINFILISIFAIFITIICYLFERLNFLKILGIKKQDNNEKGKFESGNKNEK